MWLTMPKHLAALTGAELEDYSMNLCLASRFHYLPLAH